jgi:hypothetical protein
MEAKFPVNANHSNMVKFKSRNDTTYTTVLGLLRDFEREAARTVEQRYGKNALFKPLYSDIRG